MLDEGRLTVTAAGTDAILARVESRWLPAGSLRRAARRLRPAGRGPDRLVRAARADLGDRGRVRAGDRLRVDRRRRPDGARPLQPLRRGGGSQRCKPAAARDGHRRHHSGRRPAAAGAAEVAGSDRRARVRPGNTRPRQALLALGRPGIRRVRDAQRHPATDATRQRAPHRRRIGRLHRRELVAPGARAGRRRRTLDRQRRQRLRQPRALGEHVTPDRRRRLLRAQRLHRRPLACLRRPGVPVLAQGITTSRPSRSRTERGSVRTSSSWAESGSARTPSSARARS